MTYTEEQLENAKRILTDLEAGVRLSDMENQDLAELLRDHIWVDYPLFFPQSMLIQEVMERLDPDNYKDIMPKPGMVIRRTFKNKKDKVWVIRHIVPDTPAKQGFIRLCALLSNGTMSNSMRRWSSLPLHEDLVVHSKYPKVLVCPDCRRGNYKWYECQLKTKQPAHAAMRSLRFKELFKCTLCGEHWIRSFHTQELEVAADWIYK